MELTGWTLFLSKIELFVAMTFSAWSLITGKFKKLAIVILLFEAVTQVATTIFGIGMAKKSSSKSWKEIFKMTNWLWKKPYGPIYDEEEFYDEFFGIDD